MLTDDKRRGWMNGQQMPAYAISSPVCLWLRELKKNLMMAVLVSCGVLYLYTLSLSLMSLSSERKLCPVRKYIQVKSFGIILH